MKNGHIVKPTASLSMSNPGVMMRFGGCDERLDFGHDELRFSNSVCYKIISLETGTCHINRV